MKNLTIMTNTPVRSGRVTAVAVNIIMSNRRPITGAGSAIRNIEDDNNPLVGEYLATARALSDAARKLRKYAYQISDAECNARRAREAMRAEQQAAAEKKRKADAKKYKLVREGGAK